MDTAQPGIMTMLQGKYPALFNIITVGAPQIHDTPEHNKLAAMFLDPAFQDSFLKAWRGKNIEETGEELASLINTEAAAALTGARDLSPQRYKKPRTL